MTKIDIEQIKADREACSEKPDIETLHIWNRRETRLPDLEKVLIEAKAAFYAIVQRSHVDPLGSSKVIDMREIAEEFLERFK